MTVGEVISKINQIKSHKVKLENMVNTHDLGGEAESLIDDVADILDEYIFELQSKPVK